MRGARAGVCAEFRGCGEYVVVVKRIEGSGHAGGEECASVGRRR